MPGKSVDAASACSRTSTDSTGDCVVSEKTQGLRCESVCPLLAHFVAQLLSGFRCHLCRTPLKQPPLTSSRARVPRWNRPASLSTTKRTVLQAAYLDRRCSARCRGEFETRPPLPPRHSGSDNCDRARLRSFLPAARSHRVAGGAHKTARRLPVCVNVHFLCDYLRAMHFRRRRARRRSSSSTCFRGLGDLRARRRRATTFCSTAAMKHTFALLPWKPLRTSHELSFTTATDGEKPQEHRPDHAESALA